MPTPMTTADKIAHFIKYNNAVPIALGLLFFATTGALAASPEVRDAVYSTETEVMTQDTSYLASARLDRYPFSMKVTGITEDGDYVYVAYEFMTMGPIDAVWRPTTKKDILRVSKALLRDGDLRAYAESELAQVRWQEIERLTKLQAQARHDGVTRKVIATTHSGLVGSLLKPTVEEVPQYRSEASPEDPLYVDNPRPLVTWDEKDATAPGGEEGGGVIHYTGTVIIGGEEEPDTSTATSTDGGEAAPAEPAPADPGGGEQGAASTEGGTP